MDFSFCIFLRHISSFKLENTVDQDRRERVAAAVILTKSGNKSVAVKDLHIIISLEVGIFFFRKTIMFLLTKIYLRIHYKLKATFITVFLSHSINFWQNSYGSTCHKNIFLYGFRLFGNM